MKKNINSLVVFIGLSILILIRVFLSNTNSRWINVVNFSGLICAFYTLGIKIQIEIKDKDHRKVVIGFFLLGLMILIIFFCMIFTEVIQLSAKANDIILLFTLMLSLPTDIYLLWIRR